MKIPVVLVALACVLASPVYSQRRDDRLNVHLVPHTHDDVGWLKTVDQYYAGLNTSIQRASVQNILDSVIRGLLEDPRRRFMYVETAFLSRWWREQSEPTKDDVRMLVKQGRLEIANGGYCMHDEAATYYTDMIDQTTLGHRFLAEELGVVPRVGWQIDPFGHSAVQGYLMGAEVGFDAMFFGRIDFQDLDRRREARELEMLWSASPSLGESADIWLGVLGSGNYGPPPGYCLDESCDTQVIQDDVCLAEYNVEQRVDGLVNYTLSTWAPWFQNAGPGGDVMYTMGEDFQWSNAIAHFKQIEKLMKHVNADGRLNVFYSTPSTYVAARHAANLTWPTKTDDFFPYADRPHAYWTGYFTSRPALKGYIRVLSSYLQAARQLEVFATFGTMMQLAPGVSSATTRKLEEAMGIAQHHDAASGTAQQHVTNDYAARLAAGAAEAEALVSEVLGGLLHASTAAPPHTAAARSTARRLLGDGPEEAAHPGGEETHTQKQLAALANSALPSQLVQCPLLNVSVCAATDRQLPTGDGGAAVLLLAYNPLAWRRRDVVRVPVRSTVQVTDAAGKLVRSQMLPLTPAEVKMRRHALGQANSEANSVFTLVFEVDVPPLGYATYYMAPTNGESAGEDLRRPLVCSGGEETLTLTAGSVAGGSHVEIELACATGQLASLRNPAENVGVHAAQELMTYTALFDKSGSQAAGAYILRTDGQAAVAVGKPAVTTIAGPVVTEVHQQFTEWASLTTRVYHNFEHFEQQWCIGNIPVADGVGKEVIVRLRTGLASGGVLHTDSNGRDMQRRVRDFRPSWSLNTSTAAGFEAEAGNYYPINSVATLGDDEAELALVTDRAQGVASLADGQVEVLLHRRLLHDDGRGVGEPLNEEECDAETATCSGLTVTGRHFVSLSRPDTAARKFRHLQQMMAAPLVLAFGDALVREPPRAGLAPPAQPFSILLEALPPNVHLLTLQTLGGDRVLLRLAHLYEGNRDGKGWDATLSQPASVNVARMFRHWEVLSVDERTLTGNQRRKDSRRLVWASRDSAQDDDEARQQPRRQPPVEHAVVKLAAMEIRTLHLTVRARTAA